VTERSGAVEHPPYIVSCGGGTGLHDRPVSGNGGLLVVSFPWQGQDLVRRLAEACRFMAEEFTERATPVRLFSSPTACQLLVTLAQSRSIVIDMMQLTGMDHSEHLG
jgi:hypothetical protein